MLSPKDVQKSFRTGGWASQEELQAFVRDTGKLPASELAKLLPILLERIARASRRRTAHAGRCAAFAPWPSSPATRRSSAPS